MSGLTPGAQTKPRLNFLVMTRAALPNTMTYYTIMRNYMFQISFDLKLYNHIPYMSDVVVIF